MKGFCTMKKTKVVIAVCAVVLFLALASITMLTLFWNGAFDKAVITDITSCKSPDADYYLMFQQVGDPEWPFGKTDVRLTLKDLNNETLNSVDTYIQNDGANAGEGTIKSVEWTGTSVIVILQASEMTDKEIVISYHKK